MQSVNLRILRAHLNMLLSTLDLMTSNKLILLPKKQRVKTRKIFLHLRPKKMKTTLIWIYLFFVRYAVLLHTNEFANDLLLLVITTIYIKSTFLAKVLMTMTLLFVILLCTKPKTRALQSANMDIWGRAIVSLLFNV